MLHLVPDTTNEIETLDPQAAFAVRYDALYETPPTFVTELMALTRYAANDPRRPARQPLPVYRAPRTHPLSDAEQDDALLLDCERYEDTMTATIRATSADDTRTAPTLLHTLRRRSQTPLPPASGANHVVLN